MSGDPTDRYVYLTSMYGDGAIPETEEDADMIERMIPLYDDGILHGIGCIVREKDEGGRYGLLASEGLNDDHEVSAEALAEASRKTGLAFIAFRDPNPAYSPQVAAFVPLDDPRATDPGPVVKALGALAALATPRADVAVVPAGTTKAKIHHILKQALECASIEVIYHKRPIGTASDGGPMAAVWGLYADLRGTDMTAAVRSIVGAGKPEWIAALAGEGTEAFVPSTITPERVRSVVDGLLVHAADKGWKSDRIGKAWALAATIHGTTIVEAAETLVGTGDAIDILEANKCEFDEPAPAPGA